MLPDDVDVDVADSSLSSCFSLPDFTLHDFLPTVLHNPLSLFLGCVDGGEDDHSPSLTAACGGPCSLSHSFFNFTMHVPVSITVFGACVLLSLFLSGAGAGGNGGDVPRSNGGGDGGPLGGGIAHGGDAPLRNRVGGTPTNLDCLAPVPAPCLVPRLGGVAVPTGPLLLQEPLGERVLSPPPFPSFSVLHRVIRLLFPGLE